MTDSGLVAPVDAVLPSPVTPPDDTRYRELFEDALVGIYVSRPDGGLVACNAAFARMLGFASVGEATGTGMSALYDEAADRERFVASIREHGHLEHHRGRLRRRDGGAIDVIETAIGEFAADGALTELRGFLIDVTVSTSAERALAERERHFRSVFSDAADAMLILDDRRVILEANPAACALFGVSVDEVVGETLDALIVDGEAQLLAAWRELLALGEARREHRVRSHGADTRLVECSYRARVHGRPVAPERGTRGGGHLCIARDITDRRLLEERLMQAEKIESVGRLAGGIAHDFNNLLTAILGYTELLLGARGENDPERRDLEEIQKAGQRAASLTQQLLAFSRKQVLLPKEVDLNQTVSGLKALLSRLIREDIVLSCELAPAPAVIRVDPTQLEQAILNLVLNARDALPSGGQIRLEVAPVRRSEVDVPPDQPSISDEYVRLRVVDNGVGLSPRARAHLFEPFFTTKAIGQGTGLGLASVYGIVRQSNGFITVESEPGAGSAFTMHFPAVAHVPAGTTGPADAATAAAPEGQTILLVEDEDAVRAVVSTVLKRQGYRVLEASGPQAAIELFGLRPADVDLLVTDVVMPEMSGPVLAQRLVGVRPELRVLFISGYADMATRPDEYNENVSFLSKPFQASALAARVRELLARGARAQLRR